MKAPKADPTAPMKFKPDPGLNNAVAASELAERLAEAEAEVQRLHVHIRGAASDMGRSLDAFIDAGPAGMSDHLREMGRLESTLKHSVPLKGEPTATELALRDAIGDAAHMSDVLFAGLIELRDRLKSEDASEAASIKARSMAGKCMELGNALRAHLPVPKEPLEDCAFEAVRSIPPSED